MSISSTMIVYVGLTSNQLQCQQQCGPLMLFKIVLETAVEVYGTEEYATLSRISVFLVLAFLMRFAIGKPVLFFKSRVSSESELHDVDV